MSDNGKQQQQEYAEISIDFPGGVKLELRAGRQGIRLQVARVSDEGVELEGPLGGVIPWQEWYRIRRNVVQRGVIGGPVQNKKSETAAAK